MKAIERTAASSQGDGPDQDSILAALTKMKAARRAEDRDAAETALGDLLLAVARGARQDGLDPESALRNAVRRMP